ncbi:hypothetical protein L7F22_037268 [Adiantum nelumboides]|nr:hypothetical protein [Adiantum nelumboides]
MSSNVTLASTNHSRDDLEKVKMAERSSEVQSSNHEEEELDRDHIQDPNLIDDDEEERPQNIESEKTIKTGKRTSKWEASGVVLGVFLANFISVGTANTVGVILHGEETDPSSPFLGVSSFKMGFAVGTSVGFSFCIGPFSNFLITRFGIRAPIALGVLLMTFALQMASLADQFWQLLLSQGILWGIGSSLCFVPAIGLPSQWFSKRRGIATGIASSGAPVGAMILSPVFQTVIDKLGVRWALRILGFILLGLGTITVLLVHPKRRANGSILISKYKVFDLQIVLTRGYAIYMAFAFIQTFGYATPILLIPSYASAIGLTAKQGANVVVILNAGLSAFAFFWGLGAGGYWALTVPCTARIVGLPRLGSAVSINFLMNFLPPIFASSIGGTTNSAGTFDVQSLARSSSFAGAGDIPKTTSFVINSASFAASPSLVTPGYLTETGAPSSVGQQNGAQNSATKSSVSLLSSNATVKAVSSDGAFGMQTYTPTFSSSLGTYLISISAIVFAAIFAL